MIFFILPFAILMAHGFKYLLEKWYGLFPRNPYARVSALLPLMVLFILMILPGLLQYYYGYRYSPNVAGEFSDSLTIIRENLSDGYLLATDNYDFYKILEEKTDIEVVNEPVKAEKLAVLGKPEVELENYQLERIITSPKRDNSDILYLYTFSEEGE